LALSARHQEPPPALISATLRRLQWSASAVTTLPLSAISPSAAIGRHAGQRLAQPRRAGGDRHPRPRALAGVASAAQGLAVDGDHIARAQERRDIGQPPSEGGVERRRIDHPEHGREGVVRGHGMLELQEVPENTFFRSAERRHLGAGRRAAEHRHEGDDTQLAKVVPGVPGAGIGDVLEGGQEQMHGGDGRPETSPPSRIHPAPKRKERRSGRRGHMRFPCSLDAITGFGSIHVNGLRLLHAPGAKVDPVLGPADRKSVV